MLKCSLINRLASPTTTTITLLNLRRTTPPSKTNRMKASGESVMPINGINTESTRSAVSGYTPLGIGSRYKLQSHDLVYGLRCNTSCYRVLIHFLHSQR